MHIEPSPSAEQALRDRVRALTHSSSTGRTAQEVVQEINQVTRGWGNYFALAQFHRSFGQLNHFVAHRLRQWWWRKHGNPVGKYEYWTQHVLAEQYGLYQMPTPWT